MSLERKKKFRLSRAVAAAAAAVDKNLRPTYSLDDKT